jgi:hypothetical protein
MFTGNCCQRLLPEAPEPSCVFLVSLDTLPPETRITPDVDDAYYVDPLRLQEIEYPVWETSGEPHSDALIGLGMTLGVCLNLREQGSYLVQEFVTQAIAPLLVPIKAFGHILFGRSTNYDMESHFPREMILL